MRNMRIAAGVAGIAMLVATGCAARLEPDERRVLDESIRAAAVASESGLKAEQAASRAEQAAARVDQAVQRAEQAAQRAEQAAQRAEQAAQQAEARARTADRAFELQQRK
jgi:methyl-accepting chemotaxis protein